MPDQQEVCLGQSVGKYRLVSRLGGGGFGTVYLAEDRYEHTQAAVKVLHVPLTKETDLKSFLNEARATRLRHPHIVSLLDFGISQGGLPFLAMEYASKGTLRDHHPKGEKIPLLTIVFYIDQIALALQYAHNHRVVHRDVKPDNILVRADGTLLVSDFGIAKLLEQSVLTSRQKLAGTPSYMAPEQHRGYPCFASDQYALAVTAYEWICGVRPFQGTAFGLTIQHMHTPPPSLRDRLPELSEEVEYVIFKALAKAPEDRFKCIQKFADALHEAAQPQSIIPPHPQTQWSEEVLPPREDGNEGRNSIFAGTALNTLTSATPSAIRRRSLKWSFSTGKAVRSSPTVHSGMAYFGSDDGNLYALDASSGQKKWAFSTDHWVRSSPIVHNGIVYFGSDDGNLYALDASSGQKKWFFPTDHWVYSSPTVHNGMVYFGSGDHKLYALDAASGQKKWSFRSGGIVCSSPTVYNGVVYFGSDDGNLYALDASSGQKKWAFRSGDWVQSSPTVDNTMVYFGSDDGNLYALDISSGQKKWAFRSGRGNNLLLPSYEQVTTSPILHNEMIYFGSIDHKLYALDAASGQKKWSFLTGDKVISSPTVHKNIIYFGSDDHKLYALDAASGQKKWSFLTGDKVISSPTVHNGIVYVGSHDGNFYGIFA